MDFQFILNSVLFGVGLAMDAFSVSLANGLKCPCIKIRGIVKVAAVFAIFQAAMPLIGWFFVTKLISIFKVITPAIPYVSLVLLLYIGGKMLFEGLKPDGDCEKEGENRVTGSPIAMTALLVQGVATSIDALSVGFTISHLTFPLALVEALIIAVVTFGICAAGVVIGRTFGTKLSGKASIFGGAILIFIGLEIFISSFF